MKSNLLQSYNSKDSLLVISTYPVEHTVHTGGGLASYTKNTVRAIKKSSPNIKIVVLANIIDKPESYVEGGTLVIRCWERNPLKLFPSILKQIFKFSKIKNVLFGFEFAAYGDVFTTSLIPVILAMLKVMGKKTVTVAHQVTAQLKDLSVHTGLSNKPGSLPLYRSSLNLFFKLMGFFSHKVVTLENELSTRFNTIVIGNKAVTIPHGLFPKKPVSRQLALKQLSLDPKNLYVLSFGYLSHYKGSDLVVKAFKKPITVRGKKVCLILAGGESPTQGQKRHYQKFYKELYTKIDENDYIIHTGFVPDKKIKSFYSVSNLVVFPYRAFMSASGPLSLAISYKKPFLVSKKLKNYSKYSFSNNPESIRSAIIKSLSRPQTLKKIVKVSKRMSIDRDFNLQGGRYLELFR